MKYKYKLMQKTKKKQKWSEQELQLLTETYPLYTSKKWKHIAQVFKLKGFKRSEIECREKWINFLDPELNNNEWSEAQLEKLYQIHDQVGTKWCVIQKYIGRTQNKIKNRFYGTLRNYVRFVVNHLERSQKSYNYHIGKLSPKFLNDMYKAQNQFRFLNQEIRDTILEMKYRVDRSILTQKIKKKKNVYQRLKTLIFKAFRNISQPKEGDIMSYDEAVSQDIIIKKEQEMESGYISTPKNEEEEQLPESQEAIKEEYEVTVKKDQLIYCNYYPFLNFPFQNYGAWMPQ